MAKNLFKDIVKIFVLSVVLATAVFVISSLFTIEGPLANVLFILVALGIGGWYGWKLAGNMNSDEK